MDSLSSDFDSFSESSSCDYQDDVEFLYGGQACSILSSLEESIGKIDDFLSFERGFLYGDLVCSVADPSGQIGRVVNVEMTVDLENINGRKIRDVNSKFLQKIRSISVGDYIVKGAWLGKVEKIVDRVTILFNDGTKGEFSTLGPEKLTPISPDLLEDSQYPFYPGQLVEVESTSGPRSTSWLCGPKKDKRDQGTVCAVDAGLVYVDWLGCATVGLGKVHAPPILQDVKNLTLLTCFAHANWQLGDWCTLPIAFHKSVAGQNFYEVPVCSTEANKHPGKVLPQKSVTSNFQEIAVITKTKTRVDVQWQDGSQSLGLESHSLLPVGVVDAHDFCPEQFVVQKGTCDDSLSPICKRWGIVKHVDAKERTVRVKWSTIVTERLTDLNKQQMEETVSAYELVEHPDYSYCPGDAVFRLHKSETGYLADQNSLRYTDDVHDQNTDSAVSYLSRIGIVLSLKHGDVEVKWASGVTSRVAPSEIYRIDKCEGVPPAPISNDEDVVEPVSSDNLSLDPKEKDMLVLNAYHDDCWKNILDPGSHSLPKAAFGFFTSITSSLFESFSTSFLSSYKHISEDGQRSEIPDEIDALEDCDPWLGDPPSGEKILTKHDVQNLEQSVEDVCTKSDIAPALANDNPEHFTDFRRFDIVTGCFDHHFAEGVGSSQHFSQVKKIWLKKVQQEWSILEKDLPETIYVRVYEDRLDLLRAAVAGAPGTPYHDGLFFFDIFLPPEYPQEPPMVHYISGGLRLNPNLYESGKVCLSLLNTWTGSGSEVWNPRSSTVLQVLVSLQALVLNERPYFNEAGYDAQIGKIEGEKNSASYNENAFLLSCRSMLYLLRKPPKHFEALVEEHFSRHCKAILSACKAYMEGAPVGSAFINEKATRANQKGSSMGFKIMLSKLFPKLIEAFSNKGIDCSCFLDQAE